MAALTGAYMESPIGGANALITGEVSEHTDDYYPFEDIESSADDGSSASASALPVTPETWAVTACGPDSFSDDWYGSIHIIPNPLALGAIATTVYKTVEVWSAYLTTTKALASIGETNATGVALSDQPAPPTVFGINESRVYRVTATATGNPTINALFQFNFPGETPILTVTGTRALIMDFAHNWQQPVRDIIEWKNNILIAKDGTEQRIPLRGMPRRWLEYLYTVFDTEKQRLKNALWQAQARSLVVPVVQDRTRTTADISADDTEVFCDTLYLGFHAGNMAMIIQDGNSEVFEVGNVEAYRLDSVTPLARAWTTGAAVYPARMCRIEAELKAPAITSTAADFQVRYEVLDEDTDSGLAPPYEGIYGGFAVAAYAPNWREPVEQSFTRKLVRHDNGISSPIIDDYHDQQRAVTRQLYTQFGRLPTRQLVRWAGTFFGAVQGALTWEPTWEADLTVTATIGTSAVTISVANTGHTDAHSPGRENIRIVLRDGTIFYRAVEDIGIVDDSTETVTIDTALAQTVEPDDIKIISFMQKVRSATPTAEFLWKTPEVMETTMAIMGVPAE